jgi:tetratricopeptide (TPR) repeat protein
MINMGTQSQPRHFLFIIYLFSFSFRKIFLTKYIDACKIKSLLADCLDIAVFLSSLNVKIVERVGRRKRMAFNTQSSAQAVNQNQRENADAGIKFFHQGRNAEAYHLLNQPNLENQPAARFALGLCYLLAQDISQAIVCFERAYRLFREAAVSSFTAESSEIIVKLTAHQIKNQIFLSPMDTDFCARFPKAASETALLALVYTYWQNGMKEQARKLAAGLTGPAFEAFKIQILNFEEGLAIESL